MKKFVCSICGYIYIGDVLPKKCPICGAASNKFIEQKNKIDWPTEHIVGISNNINKNIIEDLNSNFYGECSEVGMYLAMSRVAYREGYSEIGLYLEKVAYEEADHAAKFCELLGKIVTNSTKKNLDMRIIAENNATINKYNLAKYAKKLNLDAIHDTVHEMAKDEARHGKAFIGLLKRFF